MGATLVDQALAMYSAGEYEKLRAFKKAKKKSWSTLGFNAEMENRVMGLAPNHLNLESSPPAPVDERILARDRAMSKRRLQKFAEANLRLLKYRPREIHAIMGNASHSVIAHIASIKEQEKLRTDPRFPLYQAMQRHKRYKAVFAGKPYGPIFS